MKSIPERIKEICEWIYKEVPEVTYEEIIENQDDYPVIAELYQLTERLKAERKKLQEELENRPQQGFFSGMTLNLLELEDYGKTMKIRGRIEQINDFLGDRENGK